MTAEQQFKTLELVKQKLGVTDTISDALIAVYVEEIGLRILHDINCTALPDALIPVWSSMTIDLLKAEQAHNIDLFGELAVTEYGVSSVKLGDTDISLSGKYDTVSSKTGGGTPESIIAQIVKNYGRDLTRFRRLPP